MHSSESEVTYVQRLLNETSLVNWKKDFRFFHLPEYLEKVVEQVHARKAPGALLSKSKSDVLTYIQDQKPLRCPKGWRVAKLGRRGIEVVVSEYRYKDTVYENAFKMYLRQVPSVGIYPDPYSLYPREVKVEDLQTAGDEEEPVAYASI